jgi:hypothetical protein
MIFNLVCDFQISENIILNDIDLSEKNKSVRMKEIVKSRFTKTHDFTHFCFHEIGRGRNGKNQKFASPFQNISNSAKKFTVVFKNFAIKMKIQS